MKKTQTVAVLMLALLSAGYGQQNAANDSTSREQLMKLFEVMHIRQQMRSVMEGVIKQQASLVRDTMRQRYPQVSEAEMARMNDYMEESLKDLPLDGVLDDMIPVYQKHLTRVDVDAMIEFYSSTTGQKLMQEMPAMTSEGMRAAYPRMQKQMEKVMQRMEEKMKEQAPKKKGTAQPEKQTQS
jgi:hypothetical protein